MATPSKLRAFYVFSFLKNLQFFRALAVPFYLYRLNFNYGRMFILEAIFSVAMMLLEIPTGVVADKWGRKVSLLLGSLFLTLGFFAFGVFMAFWILVLGEVVCALGMTFVSGFGKAFLNEFLVVESLGGEGFLIIFKKKSLRNFGLDYAAISVLTFFMFWFYQSLLAREGVPVS